MQMPSPAQSRTLRSLAPALLVAMAAFLASPAPAQIPGTASTLPANPPTSLPAANALPAPIAATPDGSSNKPHHSEVSYQDGLLDVRADDSSLNEILHSISRQTGMKISGGVTDQRVFGNYGPSAPADVLATLLDGTGTNLLLREDPETKAPVELVLTPRGGGPSPPSPDSQSYDDGPQPGPRANPFQRRQRGMMPSPTIGVHPQMAPPMATPAMVQPANNPLGSPANTTPTASQIPTTNSVSTDSLPQPSTSTQTQQGIVDSANPPPPGTTTSTSPNGVKTPEQIYQQLLKLQQQKQQSQSGATPNSTPSTTTTPQ